MCQLTVGTNVIHSLDHADDTSTRGTAQQRPIPVKRLAHLTWSKGGGPAHGKLINSLFAYNIFTAP